MTDPVLFCFAVLALLATPGPTNTLLALSGAATGFRRSLIMVPAELAGYLAAILTVGLIVGPVLAHPPWSIILRIAVAIYLAVLAVRVWRSKLDETPRIVVPRDVLVTTFLNPKAPVFALVIIPLQDRAWLFYLAGFCMMLVTMSLVWIAAGTALGRGLLKSGLLRILFRAGAVAIAVFAVIVVWPLLRAVI